MRDAKAVLRREDPSSQHHEAPELAADEEPSAKRVRFNPDIVVKATPALVIAQPIPTLPKYSSAEYNIIADEEDTFVNFDAVSNDTDMFSFGY